MKQKRTILSLLLAAAFSLSGLQALACGTSCAGMQANAACAQRCGMDVPSGHAGGMRTACCGHMAGHANQTVALAPARVQTAQPEFGSLVLLGFSRVDVAILSPAFRAADGRAPPSANPYLWSHYPQANAPPISL